MAVHGEAILRQRVCRGSECHAVFWICRHCDRGQRYCSPACRAQARLQQRRRANDRHQRSPEGRLDHRDRQREYRKRCAERTRPAGVTDQGSLSIASSATMPEWDTRSAQTTIPASSDRDLVRRAPHRRPGPPLHCMLCGRSGRFVDAFPHIPLRR